MSERRQFFQQLGLAGAAVAAASVSRVSLAALPEIVSHTSAAGQAPLQVSTGKPFRPVYTLNGWSLPWRMNQGVKEFHLVAEAVVREIAPGMKVQLWGYNGQSPGPTIEVVEGDRVRIFVTNRLPEATSIHWHGQRLPNGMDGVSGLTQRAIAPGKTFVYEFVARRAGSFMYHPHADEMTQMAMGMMGAWITHPKPGNSQIATVDRDFVFLINAFDVEPGSAVPTTATMTDFNLWCWNSRAFPGIESLNVRQHDKVRIRVGNLTMTNHPIHIHGHEFVVTGTDGGAVPKCARWPEVTTDIAVGQMRQIELVADELGDWAFHCHKSHHTMNPMGHKVPNMIGVDQRAAAEKIQKVIPGYMAMGSQGMSEMAEMAMPIPENTLPMMMGEGPFGALEMGGMFSVLKVRANQAAGDYRDPGWYQHPANTVAWEYQGLPAELPQTHADHAKAASRKPDKALAAEPEFKAHKPEPGHQHHH